MFSGKSPSTAKNYKFVLDILDGMYDWVRVIDRENNVIFLNRSFEQSLHTDMLENKKCFEMLGLETKCKDCVSCRVFQDHNTHQAEKIVGGNIYSVLCSPIFDEDNEVNYVVEVIRDLTYGKIQDLQITRQGNRLKKDLDMAKRLQHSILPINVDIKGIDFHYKYIPCDFLGGDFLEIYSIDDKHVGFYIADVSGHGVSAAMLTVFLKSSINRSLLSPAKTINDLYICFNNSKFDMDFYITLFHCIINIETGELRFCSAGHNATPFIIKDEGLEFLCSSNIPISNWLDFPEYKDTVTFLTKGDSVFFYTDGLLVSDLLDSSNVEHIEAVNRINKENSLSSDILKALSIFISNHVDFCTLVDDFTMAVIKLM